MIDGAAVEHVARLARLALTDAERERIGAELSAILEYVAKLEELDVSAVEPTSHAVGLVNVMREDEPRPCQDQAEALANAPDRAGALFRVPRIIED
jgi:aspartyl-tRNA(Asn)/glutamyl-tRNA(Gln) amidotransferase subunit C